ncbi:MAG TPA: NUDIX domain-containing protein [Thermoplasmata archaeon]|nr:NUDIX domain-containing protein [Thermoplasmata archaeon]
MEPSDRTYRPDRPIVAELASGAVLVHRESGAICLLFYRPEARWALPKGHVDPGESLSTAALREVREETGIAELELSDEVAEVHYRFFDAARSLNVAKTTVYFLAFTSETQFRTEPIFDRGEWVDLAEATRRVPFDTDRYVLGRAAERLRAGAAPH